MCGKAKATLVCKSVGDEYCEKCFAETIRTASSENIPRFLFGGKQGWQKMVGRVAGGTDVLLQCLDGRDEVR